MLSVLDKEGSMIHARRRRRTPADRRPSRAFTSDRHPPRRCPHRLARRRPPPGRTCPSCSLPDPTTRTFDFGRPGAASVPAPSRAPTKQVYGSLSHASCISAKARPLPTASQPLGNLARVSFRSPFCALCPSFHPANGSSPPPYTRRSTSMKSRAPPPHR